jgi:hypothetical protein
MERDATDLLLAQFFSDLPAALNSRVAVKKDGRRGWCKYIGNIKDKPSNQQYAGILMDQSDWGLNNGSVNGEQYFNVPEGSKGSFISTEQVTGGSSFLQGFLAKYQTETQQNEESHIQESSLGEFNGGKEALLFTRESAATQVTFTFKKSDSTLKVTVPNNLKIISLHQYNVSHHLPEHDPLLKQIGENIIEIDLSANLISDYNTLHGITNNFPQLNTLNLTACRFVELEKELPANLTFNNVTVLVLNDCAMPWSQIEKLKKSFPNLQELHLGKNNLRTIDATGEFVIGFDQLTTLNISDNAFENWSEITKLGKLPKLQRLFLNNNKITSISVHESAQLFLSLNSLSMSDNLIADWHSIDQLNHVPSLQELRFQANPVVNASHVLPPRLLTVARVKNLTIVNGSVVRPKEREDAEKLYLKQVVVETIKQHPELSPEALKDIATLPVALHLHPRYKELLTTHGAPALAASLIGGKDSANTLIDEVISLKMRSNLAANPSETALTKKLPATMQLGQLKTIIAKLFKTDSERIQLQLITSDSPIMPTLMDDDLNSLSYYGATEGAEIIVQDK